MNVLVLNFKKSIFSFLMICFIISLLIFSNSNIKAAQEGLYLWATSVVPVLFPFFIGVELLYCTNLVNILGKYCKNLMKVLFNLSGEAIFPIIMGTLSGYPTGAKIVSNLRMDKKISKTEGEHLLAFTNNSGPLFILGTVGVSIFCNMQIGTILLITHILGSITVGVLFKFWKPNRKFLFMKNESNIDNSNLNLGTIIINSISNSITTILNIGGFVVLFSVIISILENSSILVLFSKFFAPFGFSEIIIQNFITGILELTNGIKNLSIIGTKNLNEIIILSSFLLGFGGLSVILQVYSIISKSDLSIKPYIVGKILHGFISAIYTIILLYIFKI